jgi:uncharacterized linocin/CFP29 family protein
MNKNKNREEKIFSQLRFDKLLSRIDKESWKKLGGTVSDFIHQVFKMRETKESLNWCFANIKRIKVFLEIFHANESGAEIYKEEISKNIPEYSYKTISKIIDDGIAKGYYVLLAPDGEAGSDGKVKNIRPSETLVVDFLNLSIEIISYIDSKKPKIFNKS